MSDQPQLPVPTAIRQDELEMINNLENAPTIYIDGAQGLLTDGNIIKINLFDIVQEISPDRSARGVYKRVLARLVMQRHTAITLATWLLKRAEANVPQDMAEDVAVD